MTLYRARVERTEEIEILVEADNPIQARDDALELANNAPDWDETFSPVVTLSEIEDDEITLVVGRDIWTGGEDGHDFQYLNPSGGRIIRTDA